MAVTSIHGIEIIGLVAATPDGISLRQLAATVADRFGEAATFHTCTTQGMTFDALLELLELRHKVRITNGMVFPGDVPICKHCVGVRNKQVQHSQGKCKAAI